MIDFKQISPAAIQTEPFTWAAIGNLYSADDAAALASTFPHNYFKTIKVRGADKIQAYEARSLVPMGKNIVSHSEDLSPDWLELAHELYSTSYRSAMSAITGYDLSDALLEVNIFHYGPGSSLGPHQDLATKLVTHAIYFNPSLDAKDGGCLNILRSADAADVSAIILPIVGNSAVIVRSEKSWHAVSPVVEECSWSRRSLTATFYHPGSPSTMWLSDDATPLHHVDIVDM